MKKILVVLSLLIIPQFYYAQGTDLTSDQLDNSIDSIWAGQRDRTYSVQDVGPESLGVDNNIIAPILPPSRTRTSIPGSEVIILPIEESQGPVNASPNDAQAYILYNRATIAYRKKQFETARDHYRDLIRRFPDSSYTPYALYTLSISEKDYRRKIRILLTIQERFPSFPHKDIVADRLGDIYYLLDSTEAAEEAFSKSKSAYALYMRAMIALDSQKPNEAIGLIRNFFKIAEDRESAYQAYMLYAEALIAIGANANALTVLEKSVDLRPWAYDNGALILLNAGKAFYHGGKEREALYAFSLLRLRFSRSTESRLADQYLVALSKKSVVRMTSVPWLANSFETIIKEQTTVNLKTPRGPSANDVLSMNPQLPTGAVTAPSLDQVAFLPPMPIPAPPQNIQSILVPITEGLPSVEIVTLTNTVFQELTNTINFVITNRVFVVETNSFTNDITVMDTRFLTNLVTNIVQILETNTIVSYEPVVIFRTNNRFIDRTNYITNIINQVITNTYVDTRTNYITNYVNQIITNARLNKTNYITNMVEQVFTNTRVNNRTNYITNYINQVLTNTLVNNRTNYITNYANQVFTNILVNNRTNYITNYVNQVITNARLNKTNYITNVVEQVFTNTFINDITNYINATNPIERISTNTFIENITNYVNTTNTIERISTNTFIENRTNYITNTNIIELISTNTFVNNVTNYMTNSLERVFTNTLIDGRTNFITNVIDYVVTNARINNRTNYVTNYVNQVITNALVNNRTNYTTNYVNQVITNALVNNRTNYITNYANQVITNALINNVTNYITNVADYIVTNERIEVSPLLITNYNTVNRRENLTNVIARVITNRYLEYGLDNTTNFREEYTTHHFLEVIPSWKTAYETLSSNFVTNVIREVVTNQRIEILPNWTGNLRTNNNFNVTNTIITNTRLQIAPAWITNYEIVSTNLRDSIITNVANVLQTNFLEQIVTNLINVTNNITNIVVLTNDQGLVSTNNLAPEFAPVLLGDAILIGDDPQLDLIIEPIYEAPVDDAQALFVTEDVTRLEAQVAKVSEKAAGVAGQYSFPDSKGYIVRIAQLKDLSVANIIIRDVNELDLKVSPGIYFRNEFYYVEIRGIAEYDMAREMSQTLYKMGYTDVQVFERYDVTEYQDEN